jgi:hypothetical protein
MVHAITLLVVLMVAAPLARFIPLAALAAILLVVSYNMGDWGEVPAEPVTIGARTFVRATYRQGFATRHVYADMSQFRPGQLWIWMWTDFADPGRPDYESQNWFVAQP